MPIGGVNGHVLPPSLPPEPFIWDLIWVPKGCQRLHACPWSAHDVPRDIILALPRGHVEAPRAARGSMHALGVPVMCPKVLSWHYPEVMLRPQGLPEAPCMPLECQ